MTHYHLHYAPDNASLIIRLTLDEMNLPYKTVLVDRSQNAHRSKTYKALNPRGLIPTLVTPHGPIFETAAILLWLTDTHGKLAPAPTSSDRGDFLKWLFYLSNGLHTDLRQLFYPEKYTFDPTMHDQHHILVRQRLQEHLSHFDSEATKQQDWFNGSHVSTLDLYIACILRWLALYPVDRIGWFNISEYPALHALAKRLELRDAVHRATQAEGLGPTPFSAPTYAQPPEGSAT